jgi:hypothetical protein
MKSSCEHFILQRRELVMESWRLERSDDSGRHARLDLESHMTHINVLLPPTSIMKLRYCAGP